MSKLDVNVSELIDNSRLNPFHIRVIALCSCLLFFEGFDFYAISYVAPALGRALAISKPMLGPIFSAGQLGLMLGALILGIAGDRWGRKRVFILCGLVFGLASLATALSTSYLWLLIWRSIAGLGMGGAGPIAITIASDYCPRRVRAALTMVMYTGFSFGGVFAGAVNAYFLRYGWQTVFYLGGAIPILLSPVLILALPESLNYLVSRKTSGAEIARILKKLAPGIPHAADSCFVMDQAYEKKVQVPELFRAGLGRRTVLLWTILFISLITLFSLTNWLPTLFNTQGIAPKQVVTIMALSQGAGLLGSLVAARLVVSYRPFHVAALGFAIASSLLLGLGKFGLSYTAILIVNPFLYFFLIGDQNIVNAMAGQLYPPKIRATGTGWGIGIGRIGGIVGPSIAGLLLAFHWTPDRLFMLAAIPTLATSAAAFAMSHVMKESPATDARPLSAME
jgi:AAHS family 4-hydroxybenzoate transporter-like MFS transporter